MPLLLLIAGVGALLLIASGGHPGDAVKAILDRTNAIKDGPSGTLFFPLADTKPNDVVMMGMPVWVYEEAPNGTQTYVQLAVSAIPPTGQIAFGLSDAGTPTTEVYLPRSHFAVGSPKSS